MKLKRTEALNLTLRAILEVGVVVGLGYWGFTVHASSVIKVVLGIGVPVLLFGFWGTIDFRQARHGEQLRLTQELAVSALAAIALYAAGQMALAVGLAVLSITYHALVYLSGERLLKPGSRETVTSPSALPSPAERDRAD